MKLRYILLLVILIVAVAVLVVYASSSYARSYEEEPIFFNAQKGFKKPRPPPIPGKKVNQPLPVLSKAPAPDKKDIGQKCKAGDEYCVYAGITGGVCKAMGCLPPPNNGDPCKYTDKNKWTNNCVKAAAPPPGKQDSALVLAKDGTCPDGLVVKSVSYDHCRPDRPCNYQKPMMRAVCVPPEQAAAPSVDTTTPSTFQGCVDTSVGKCDPSKPCVHYTCKTDEDAKRINPKSGNFNFTCEKDTVLQCKNVGNTTFCGCGLMVAKDYGGKCPAGLVLKKIGVNVCEPNKPCPKIARVAYACVQPEGV